MLVSPDRQQDLPVQPDRAAGAAPAVAPLLRGGRDILGLIAGFVSTEDLANFAVASRGVRGAVAEELAERRAKRFDAIRAEVSDLEELPRAKVLARLAEILGDLPLRMKGDPTEATSRAGWLRGAVREANPDGNSALHYAAEDGQVGVVDWLIAAGADLRAATQHGSTALHWAANGGYVEMVDRLLKADADPRAANQDGDTALHWAVGSGRVAIVDRLLTAGADPKAANQNGSTALHWAARGGYVAIVDRLLNAGADPHAANQDGNTALHLAIGSGHDAVVNRLLMAGADPRASNLQGRTPLSIANMRRLGTPALRLPPPSSPAQSPGSL
ncbi:hypothetical protein LMG19083_04661 [Ralstonia psammae]|uniref:Ankyrin repeat domain-containing protein n=1 Tax=Ralstonia psammae TaxID=3058598 RepID=A0ABM9JY15_9RALS|nr:ankyrin repeat domain-containing protein [Ralstonia sp. LMG 19083]CAJ0808136.1 hypothetical protein LMG19083_04661 [Ralstonia sp. LMG 19083]